VEIDVLARATPATLHETIVSHALEQRPYDVAHFIGHGEFDREANEGRLIFDAGDGAQQPVGVQTLREILCGRGLQLVFLNACDTARDPSRKLNRGVAQALVQGGLPAVVANQYKVLDPSAVAFAQHFYWALAQGASLGEAAREARIAVNYSLEGEVIDWAVPVLYARDPDQRFCTRTRAAAPLTQPPGTPPRRRPSPAARVQKVRRTPPPLSVAVADIARFFPSLAAILERLNAVQSRFQFRLVEINVPMGVWQKIPGEQRTYLNAARFAEKLKTRPHSLGVDVLACVTNWWLRDNTAADLHGWWSDDPEVPIVIFSTAGLALPANDPQTSRVIGNGLTGSLASYFLAANSKAAGVRSGRAVDDVFYFGAGRNFARMTERQHFPPASRALLRKHLPSKLDPPATLAALEALLGAFDDGAGMVR
jgi:CHAT domain